MVPFINHTITILVSSSPAPTFPNLCGGRRLWRYHTPSSPGRNEAAHNTFGGCSDPNCSPITRWVPMSSPGGHALEMTGVHRCGGRVLGQGPGYGGVVVPIFPLTPSWLRPQINSCYVFWSHFPEGYGFGGTGPGVRPKCHIYYHLGRAF